MASRETPTITAKNYLTVPPGEYPCGNNLYLIVSPTGNGRRWLFRYQLNGVKGAMGFGAAKDVKLSEAKDNAIDARRLLAKGLNPKQARDETRRATGGSELFGSFTRSWADKIKTGLKHPASKAKLDRIVDVICLPLHRLSLEEIDTQHIVDVLMTVWHLREVSRDTRQRLKQIFDAAIALEKRRRFNPADWARLKPLMPKQKRRGRVRGSHKGIDRDKLPALMQTLAAIPDQSARALEITILTLVRTIETRNMRWSQLDLDAGLWNLNFDDTKIDRAKRTPLPKQTLAYLRQAYRDRISDFVFPGRDLKSPISNNTMLKALKEVTGDATLTVHGFRSTFRTWAQEETKHDRETVEHCMHHILGDAAEQTYKTGEALKKRREVMQDYADFATRPPAQVIAFNQRA